MAFHFGITLQSKKQYTPTQRTQEKVTAKVQDINYEITDKLEGDVLQCFSHGPNRDKFCDFTVVVGDTEFPCHGFVLSACSGFFEALLRSDMKESREKKATIQEISPEIFQLILDVIYGKCKVLVPEKMIDIWKAAHQLQIQPLLSACESYFVKNINADNCGLIYTHAHLIQSPNFVSSVLNYMVNNFYALVKTDNFLKIGYEDFLQIIRNKNLRICADFKIEAILKWCEAGNKNAEKEVSKSVLSGTRLPYLGSLIQTVGLEKTTKACLASLLTNPFIQGDKIANAAVNSQAAKNLVNPTQLDNRVAPQWGNTIIFPNQTGETDVCQHCNQSQNLRKCHVVDVCRRPLFRFGGLQKTNVNHGEVNEVTWAQPRTD